MCIRTAKTMQCVFLRCSVLHWVVVHNIIDVVSRPVGFWPIVSSVSLYFLLSSDIDSEQSACAPVFISAQAFLAFCTECDFPVCFDFEQFRSVGM